MVRIAVIGCGALAHDGHEVRVHDSNSAALNKVCLRLNEDRRILKEDGLLLNTNFVGDVYCFNNLDEAVRSVEFVFECVAEELEVKKDLFRELDQICDANVILATSSMRLDIDDITDGLSHRERCLGVRFLFPVYFVPEVELQTSSVTSLETLDKVRSFLEQMGRVAFFRTGNEPIVLNEEQRDARKAAYMRQMNEGKGLLGKRLSHPVPNLGPNFEAGVLGQLEQPLPANQAEKECVVCMDKSRDCVLHPCHHLCTCIQCGRLLLKRQDACPICRRTITNAFRVYHS